jgi:hypothetical protein
MVAALLKAAKSYPEREHIPARDVLRLTLLDTGEDLVASAGGEVFEMASDLEVLTPVGINFSIERTIYNGNSARLRVTRLEAEIDGERQVASDEEHDDSAKAARKQLADYRKRLSH